MYYRGGIRLESSHWGEQKEIDLTSFITAVEPISDDELEDRESAFKLSHSNLSPFASNLCERVTEARIENARESDEEAQQEKESS